MEREHLTADTLFVGITRPTMKFGVTYAALLANAMLTMEVFAFTQNLLWLLMFVPIHGVFVLLCMYEPRFFDMLMAWARTSNAASYSPFATNFPDAKGKRRQKNVEVIL